jgi:hypothetical protein
MTNKLAEQSVSSLSEEESAAFEQAKVNDIWK